MIKNLIFILSQKWHQRCIRISKFLFIACGFSSGIFNVLGHIPNALTSSIYMAFLHFSLAFYLTWTIVSDANEGRKLIFSKNLNKKIESSKSNLEKGSPNESNQKNGPRSQPIDWLLVSLRLSKIAFFPHSIIILSFYSNSKKPIDPLSSEQVS